MTPTTPQMDGKMEYSPSLDLRTQVLRIADTASLEGIDGDRLQQLCDLVYRQEQELVSQAAAIRSLQSQLREAKEALQIGESWLERWGFHRGTCAGGDHCTCGLTRVMFDLRAALTPPRNAEKE